MPKESDYQANKERLVEDIKEWLKYIPSSYVEFKNGKNRLELFCWGERIPHTLISIEWIKRDGLDYVEVLSFNDNYEPDEMTPDSDDIMDFDYDEIRAIYKLAQANTSNIAR